MSKHKHYDMIVAKAANMDLILFVKCGKNDKWKESETPVCFPLSEFEDVDYFLCLPLPQHKEACLHWLNGGETEFEDDDGEWVSCSDWSKKWRQSICGFMQDDNVIRIKPKKVKRWIGVTNTGKVTPDHYSDVDDLKSSVIATSFDGWQFFEIEVEE